MSCSVMLSSFAISSNQRYPCGQTHDCPTSLTWNGSAIIRAAGARTIEAFVQSLDVSPEYIDELFELVGEAYDKQQIETHKDSVTIDLRLVQLRDQIRLNVDKIKMVNSETTIKYLEADIQKLEEEIATLTQERQSADTQQPIDMDKAKAYVRYYLEHLEELLLHHKNPVLQARYFGVLFNTAPTYEDIVSGTPDCSNITGVNSLFVSKFRNHGHVAGAKGRL